MLQQTRSKISYDEVLANVIEKVRKQGYDNIRADLSDYDSPHQLIGKTNNVNFTPDVTATKNEGKAYFEISTKMDNPNELINKWKLLETLASMKNGTFQIYVPHGHMKFTQELVKDHNIRAEIVKI
ncbi:hypothetical protein [Marinoscillum pacificum]|uniref:hypothetical protein n=1 Tax=Marinoscillum pacificum TaxID=392723 RepID=UPI0021585F7E|nr:hypothetical protein [Marinoscillum pacificum]